MDLEYTDYVADRGAFRQRDLTPRVAYDADYLARQSGTPESHKALAALRLRVLEAFVPDAETLLDFGCGRGDFVREALAYGWEAAGHDLVRYDEKLPFYANVTHAPPCDVVAFMDSLEHLPYPAATIMALAPRWLYISLPECHRPNDPEWFMGWRHRRPNEHLWHWNRTGLDEWMAYLGYRPVMHGWHEDAIRTPYDPELPNILSAIYQRRN